MYLSFFLASMTNDGSTSLPCDELKRCTPMIKNYFVHFTAIGTISITVTFLGSYFL